MKLSDLEAEFIKILDEKTHKPCETLQESDGLFFLCPVCFVKNKGSMGTHGIICWRPHVPQTRLPIPGRWDFLGTGLNDLTLVAGSSSIKLDSGCGAHFFITRGQIA